jgi:hypothetical protein
MCQQNQSHLTLSRKKRHVPFKEHKEDPGHSDGLSKGVPFRQVPHNHWHEPRTQDLCQFSMTDEEPPTIYQDTFNEFQRKSRRQRFDSQEAQLLAIHKAAEVIQNLWRTLVRSFCKLERWTHTQGVIGKISDL